MNLSKIRIIIAREYLNKVKKKSFLLITFLAPLFFAGMCLLPSIIMMAAKEEAKKIGVVDYSGFVLDRLSDSESVTYQDLGTDLDVGVMSQGIDHPNSDVLRSTLSEKGVDAVLTIVPMDSVSVVAATYFVKDLGMETSSQIQREVNDAVEGFRTDRMNARYDFDLQQLMGEVRADVQMLSLKVSDDGSVNFSESGILSILSMILGLALYMFIMMFCGMVMSSVIEEKSSRVVEVLISSVKATELMFGKIIGVALVAMTQFLLWILLTVALLTVAGFAMGFDTLMGAGAIAADPTGTVADPSGMAVLFSTLSQINFSGLLICFFLFFIFGYLLYASLYAAIGSAVETEADTQQLQIPLTIPLMIGMFISIYTMKAPDSDVVFWGSMIPFTSPVVMLSRIPFNPPLWEIALSLAILIGTFILMAWFSAKVYKVGVLMFGKKSTFKDLWKWFRQDN